MKFGMYVLRDQKAGFLSPSVDVSDASAVRNFDTAVRKSNDIMHFHKEDFDLFKIGEYDSDSGIVKAFDAPEFIINGGSIDE